MVATVEALVLLVVLLVAVVLYRTLIRSAWFSRLLATIRAERDAKVAAALAGI